MALEEQKEIDLKQMLEVLGEGDSVGMAISLGIEGN